MVEFTKDDMFWIRSSLIKRKIQLMKDPNTIEDLEEHTRLKELVKKLDSYLVEQDKLKKEQNRSMEKFRQFVIEELGLDDAEDDELLTLFNELGMETIEKLYSQDYHLLSLDNFKDCYGEDSKLLIKEIDCDGWFEIALYHNIYK